jgi:phospholipase/carboxylesterase
MNAANAPQPRLPLPHQAVTPPGAGPHPTVIALHGRGSNEADLLGLAPYLDGRLQWISPRAPLELQGGYEWYRLRQIGVPDQASFTQALRTVTGLIREATAAYAVDPAHLYLLGFSQGGMMAYSVTLTEPSLVSGMIAHSSYVPRAALEAAASVDAAGIQGKPMLALHGTADPMIPLAWAQAARDYVKELGAEVGYAEFPMGHTVSQPSLAAMNTWLQQQLNGKA